MARKKKDFSEVKFYNISNSELARQFWLSQEPEAVELITNKSFIQMLNVLGPYYQLAMSPGEDMEAIRFDLMEEYLEDGGDPERLNVITYGGGDRPRFKDVIEKYAISITNNSDEVSLATIIFGGIVLGIINLNDFTAQDVEDAAGDADIDRSNIESTLNALNRSGMIELTDKKFTLSDRARMDLVRMGFRFDGDSNLPILTPNQENFYDQVKDLMNQYEIDAEMMSPEANALWLLENQVQWGGVREVIASPYESLEALEKFTNPDFIKRVKDYLEWTKNINPKYYQNLFELFQELDQLKSKANQQAAQLTYEEIDSWMERKIVEGIELDQYYDFYSFVRLMEEIEGFKDRFMTVLNWYRKNLPKNTRGKSRKSS
jgi:hypothetical protein